MIICNIQGGLGNQMFQYAMARSLSLDCDLDLKFCIDSFLQYRMHNGFELDRVFGIRLSFATSEELKKIIGGWRAHPLVRRALAQKKFKIFRGSQYKVDSQTGYDPSLISLGSKYYLHGYWQSERYFLKHADQIRKDFFFSDALDQRNLQLLEKISRCNAVSIHVRRGDYISNTKALATHGLCGLDYYNLAIERMKSQTKDPQFFVFTDDPGWVKAEFLTRHPGITVVDHNIGVDSYKDMQLMATCSHHIIANSSFSWWGAWLNPSKEKLVIAPKKWFASGEVAPDLLPPSWEKI